MIKALKEKSAKLAQMKEENAAQITKLKAALENSTDGDKARLTEELKAAKITSLELDRKGFGLEMKKLELALNKETDPVKIELLKKKGAELKAKDEEYAQKLAQVKPNGTEAKKK
jgi:hypothetical protein